MEEEFGGYVEPPTHLSKKAGVRGGGPLPPELRTIPDYDYSLFRYSRIAIPFLALIFVTSGILLGLTFWQGPVGFRRGVNGLQDGIPRDFRIADLDHEGGLHVSIRNLRLFDFVIGVVILIILGFGIAARPTPGPMKAILAISALFLFTLFVTATIAFALGIDEFSDAEECRWFTFNDGGLAPNNHFRPARICDDRDQLSIANTIVDAFYALTALILCIVLVRTMGKRSWCWGPGRVAVEKSIARPRIDYPPPSQFTHIHSTRRLYVWVLLVFFTIILTVNFILTIMLHELRIRPLQVRRDIRGIDHNWVQEKRGWAVRNTRFRITLTAFICGIVVLNFLDIIASKRRWVAYVLAVIFFYTFIGALIIFAMDVHDVNDADDLPCPDGTYVIGTGIESFSVQIECAQWMYFGTCFLDFALAIMILVYVIFEFLYRANATWDSFYFYADSEWLRNHSLFVEATDREAYDWRKYTMETGRVYYYSPTLGISTRVPPANFVDTDVASPFPIY